MRRFGSEILSLIAVAYAIAAPTLCVFFPFNRFDGDASAKNKILVIGISATILFFVSILYLLIKHKNYVPDIRKYGNENPKKLFLIVLVFPFLLGMFSKWLIRNLGGVDKRLTF